MFTSNNIYPHNCLNVDLSFNIKWQTVRNADYIENTLYAWCTPRGNVTMVNACAIDSVNIDRPLSFVCGNGKTRSILEQYVYNWTFEGLNNLR